MVPGVGFEPTTRSFRDRRSTTELTGHKSFALVYGIRTAYCRPLEGRSPTVRRTPHLQQAFTVDVAVDVTPSFRMSKPQPATAMESGGGEGTRTLNNLLAKQALYQLSYTPIKLAVSVGHEHLLTEQFWSP